MCVYLSISMCVCEVGPGAAVASFHGPVLVVYRIDLCCSRPRLVFCASPCYVYCLLISILCIIYPIEEVRNKYLVYSRRCWRCTLICVALQEINVKYTITQDITSYLMLYECIHVHSSTRIQSTLMERFTQIFYVKINYSR